jgi:hypothetical protein
MSTTHKLPEGSDPEDRRERDSKPTYVRRNPSTTIVVGRTENMGAEVEDNEDRVSGWLVVVKGPGIGEVLTLGYGVHSVGRNSENRVLLDFGDGAVSGYDHFRVIYDPDTAAFYVQMSVGTNLIKLDGHRVLDRVPLQPGSLIGVGQTVLRFVPFCTPEFDWTKVPT